ncbi:MAG: DUF4923 family protein [Muribaculaceae bacterium]|nr:DUF4923 family protein [Muribaculaceae bacterium]
MKKLFVAAMALCMAFNVSADIKDILSGLAKGLGSQSGSTTTTTTTNDTQSTTSSSTGTSSIFDNIASIGNALGIIPSQKVDVNYLVGQWKYSKPAVAFKSENFLNKAGGAVASSTIESKLATYYEKAGMKNLQFTVAEDSTFTMNLSKISLGGTVLPSPDEGTVYFQFKAIKGKLPLGKIKVFVNAESSSTMSLTFDVSKLIDIVSKLSSVIGNSTLQTASNLLSSYDGITAGFRLTKQR